jgi:hypothetical protein
MGICVSVYFLKKSQPKCLHVVTTLVNEKITGFDCPILDISDSKMGKVGLVILVDMSTNMAPTREGDRYLKLTSAHGNIVLYAVCPACRAGRFLFFEQFCSSRTVAEQ